MADGKSMADTIAGYFNKDQAPSPDSDSQNCPHCGKPVDKGPYVDPVKAKQFQDSFNKQPDYMKNLKEGLGIK